MRRSYSRGIRRPTWPTSTGQWACTKKFKSTTPLFEAHLVQTTLKQKGLMAREREIICFIQQEIEKLQHWMVSTFPSRGGKRIHSQQGVTVERDGDALIVRKFTPIKTY